ncbi:OmpH family outer membrane protein [Desulfovibrio aminophilus]|nr:OmpH family outer membrane protein [Desulfovibrio aminophilus]MCM0754258.1 OmpH family outer membrane protein [Desulfovibrio aminophilus]
MTAFRAAVFGLVLALVLAVPAHAQQGKVGFLHPQRILNESKVGKTAQEDLSRFAQEKDRRIRSATQEIQALQNELKAGNLPEDEGRRKADALRQKLQQQDRLIQESNEEVRVEEQRLARYVMQKADAIMRQIAVRQGFTMILTDPEAIGYVDPSMDITDQVLRALDQAGDQTPPKKK